MKTTKRFELDQAKKLVPVIGNTMVTVESDGEYEVINCKATHPRGPRKITLEATEYGEMYRSPMGQHRSVRITLPTESFSITEVKRQVDLLFDKYLVNMY